MKPKYAIGFFAVVFLIFALVTAGYQISYRSVTGRQDTNMGQTLSEESVAAEGRAEKGTDKDETEEGEVKDPGRGYVVKELHGFVVVYEKDGTTLYEMTDILSSDLPGEVRQEIAEGKRIHTEKELYAFLENYSS